MKISIIFGLIIITGQFAFALDANLSKRKDMMKNYDKSGWSDGALVDLYHTFDGAQEKERQKGMQKAILNPKFPDEGRPTQFFNTLASYFDKNNDGHFTMAEVSKTLEGHADRYYELLRESQAAQGPQEELTSDFRVKTWKMMQKIALLKKELVSGKKKEWSYKPVKADPASAAWDSEHTISTTDDFKKRVCDRSREKAVLVKFGSTQCADCMLLEYNQGIRATATKYEKDFDVIKVWWGPNVAKEMDTLRQAEGVKSSPSFFIYKNKKRYACGFGFPDETGTGLEKCLQQNLNAVEAAAPATCGS